MLRLYNPGLEVHGLYGGADDSFEAIKAQSVHDLDSLFCDGGRSPKWKWMNNDLSVRRWYLEHGCSLEFDSVVVVEWDLIMFASIDDLYGHLPPDSVAVTAPVPLTDVEARWFWTPQPGWRQQVEELLAHCERRHGWRPVPRACLNVGIHLPRGFLHRFATEDVPELGHDEIRIPIYAAILGYPLVDTGFYGEWFDSEVEQSFNCNRRAIEPSRVAAEVSQERGRRVFHPVFDTAIHFHALSS